MSAKKKMILGLPKSIYFNFKCFDFKTAIHLPFILGPDVKMGKLHKGCIILNDYDKNRYHIKFGIGGSEHVPKEDNTWISFGKNSRIVFNGKAMLGEGTRLRCDYGYLTFGDNFSCSKNCCFNCEDHITIGKDVLFGWNIYVRDTDGHDVFENDELKVAQKSVEIQDHTWICSFAHVLKGAVVPKNSVVAWRSTVLKEFLEENILIGGSPAKVIKHNISWKK